LGSAHRHERRSLPVCRRSRGLLLAQDLLGLFDQDLGPGRQACTGVTDYQSSHGSFHGGPGVASGVHRRLVDPPQPGVPPHHPPSHHSRRRSHLPGHQRRPLLSHRAGCLLLGLQRRRDHLCQALDTPSKRPQRLSRLDIARFSTQCIQPSQPRMVS
ncbi:hypothetical protein CT0861_09751, partial [Colletotrichum tofieldiae]